jgi:hypothetical protein
VAAAADEAPGHGEQAQARPFEFPAAGGPGEGEHGHPGEQFAGQGDDLAPDLVLGVAVQGQVAQAGVLGGADAVLASGAAAVAQFQVGELPALGVGGKAGEPVAAGKQRGSPSATTGWCSTTPTPPKPWPGSSRE